MDNSQQEYKRSKIRNLLRSLKLIFNSIKNWLKTLKKSTLQRSDFFILHFCFQKRSLLHEVLWLICGILLFKKSCHKK